MYNCLGFLPVFEISGTVDRDGKHLKSVMSAQLAMSSNLMTQNLVSLSAAVFPGI